MPDDQVETRSVTLDQAKAGVDFDAGRQAILIIGQGGGAGPTPDPPPDPEPGPTPDPPAVTPSVQASFGAAHFETDKTFPLPSALDTFRAVAALANSEPKRIFLVIGHTDATGTPAHNLSLSGERAASIAAYLRSDADAWMKFYESAHSGKTWGLREDMHMLHALPFGGAPYLSREPGDAPNADYRKALRDFQRSNRAPETGSMDRRTRKLLVEQYMAAEGTTVPKGLDLQTLACGQRHLIEQTRGPSETNRRVDVLAFEGPIKPPPSDCSHGKHPGCTAYDKWIGEVTGQIP